MSSGTRKDPFIAFRYEVRLDDLPPCGFSEVSGLTMTTASEDYAEGGVNDFVHKLPGPAKQDNIVLKRGVVDRSLWEWYAALLRGDVKYRNGDILIKDVGGNGNVMKVTFRRAFPSKWSGPALDASQSKVAVESIELCHNGLSWES